MRDVLSLTTAVPKLTRCFLRFDSICLRCLPFFSLHITSLKPTTCLLPAFNLRSVTQSYHMTPEDLYSARGDFCKCFWCFVNVWSFTYESLCDDPSIILLFCSTETTIFSYSCTRWLQMDLRWTSGLMFTASAFMSKSRWISSFPPLSLLQIHVYTGYKS